MGRGSDHRRDRDWGGGQPDDSGYGRAPSRPYDGPPTRRPASPVAGEETTGTVKWYKSDKGFGFVTLADGQDAFLHASVLVNAGMEDVPSGATLRLTAGPGSKGMQVVSVLSVDVSTAEPRGPSPRAGGPGAGRGRPEQASGPTVTVNGTVKWYDDNKGFGFAQGDDGRKDVFLHASALRAAGLQWLEEGQKVVMEVRDTPKGREATTLRVA